MKPKKRRMLKALRVALCFGLLLAVLFSAVGCGWVYRKETKKLQDKGSTQFIAHRGLSGLAPENTAEAFLAAAQRSYFGIEADLRKTADGKFVICHDDTLKKMANEDISIAGSTYETLMNVALIDRQGQKNPNLHLCDLESYIGICKEYGKQAILEFKCSLTEQEIENILHIIEELDYLFGVTFISGQYQQLLTVRQFSPEQEVQLVVRRVDDELLERLIADQIDVAVRRSGVSASLIEKLHNAGRKINVWTVNGKFRANRLIDLGVDYITTNILE